MTKGICRQGGIAPFWWQVVPVMMAGVENLPIGKRTTRRKK